MALADNFVQGPGSDAVGERSAVVSAILCRLGKKIHATNVPQTIFNGYRLLVGSSSTTKGVFVARSRTPRSDEIVVDAGSIASEQQLDKQAARYSVETTDAEIVLRIKYPALPDDSKADPAAVRALFQWWMEFAAATGVAVVPKAIEYSSEDLYILGREMAETMAMDLSDMSRGQLEEMGIFFYESGKMARWSGAIRDGRLVSLDTIRDLVIYATMAARIRETGNWPGVELS